MKFLPYREKYILSILIFIFAILIGFIPVFYLRYSVLNDEHAIKIEKSVEIYITESLTRKQLISLLKTHDIDINTRVFDWAASTLGWRKFRIGHYILHDSYSYDKFLSKFGYGNEDGLPITILPGDQFEVLIERLAEQFLFSSSDVRQVLQDTVYMKSINLVPEELLSRSLPNTYDMFWTWSPKIVFKRLLNEFEKKVVKPYQNHMDSLGVSVSDIIKLASIIEWEAKNVEEGPRISGVYWNRLNKKMRLEADPTVLYALGEKRRLRHRDYKVKSKYNTYMYRGLPPTPITNPSLSSIKAALYPEKHNYLFMVANPQGTHDYSENYEDHIAKSKKWQNWIRQQYRIKRQLEKQ